MLNMEMDKPALIQTAEIDWQASPREGVWRKPLAREDAERGHATSMVRFDAGSRFTEHGHPLGEEVLVLDGVFSDHTGDFVKGSYFRNPPGFSHAPFSVEGCTLFVKLHQFLPDDKHRVCINYLDETGCQQWQNFGDCQSLLLHEFDRETVRLVRSFSNPVSWTIDDDGAELLVVEGGVGQSGISYSAGAWLRNPPASTNVITLGVDSLLWIKTGHLHGSTS